MRLNNLIPELLDMVDDKKLAFNPAVELSYLDKESQKDVDESPFTQRKRTSVDQYETEIKFRKPDFQRQISYRNGEPFASLLYKEGRAWTIDPKKDKATEITGHQLRLFHVFNSFSHPSNNLEDVFSTI